MSIHGCRPVVDHRPSVHNQPTIQRLGARPAQLGRNPALTVIDAKTSGVSTTEPPTRLGCLQIENRGAFVEGIATRELPSPGQARHPSCTGEPHLRLG